MKKKNLSLPAPDQATPEEMQDALKQLVGLYKAGRVTVKDGAKSKYKLIGMRFHGLPEDAKKVLANELTDAYLDGDLEILPEGEQIVMGINPAKAFQKEIDISMLPEEYEKLKQNARVTVEERALPDLSRSDLARGGTFSADEVLSQIAALRKPIAPKPPAKAPEQSHLKAVIRRTRDDMVRRTPLTAVSVLEDVFLNEQHARGNSEMTMKHYERTFKKLYQFLAFHNSDLESYKKLLEDESELLHFGKTLPMIALESDDIDMHFREYLLENDKVSEQTIASYFRDYRAICYFAMDKEWIKKRVIHVKEVEPPIKDCYTKKELEKLLKKPKIDNFVEYRNWVIINYFMGTGNRVASVCALKVGDVDLDTRHVKVLHQKNKTPALLPIDQTLTQVLREYIREYRCDYETGEVLANEPLFCDERGERALTPDNLKKTIAAYNKSRGVSKTSCHLFRHTFAKNWILSNNEKGGDIVSLAAVLNQKTLKMVQRYANLYGMDLQQKIDNNSLLSSVRRSGSETLQSRRRKAALARKNGK